MRDKKFYLTAAIPYVNARPHLGHALEFIQGDVVARHHSLHGEDVCYISGADENSIKNVQAAEQEGITPGELCDRNTQAFIDLAGALHVRFDRFYRSSSPEHAASSRELWERCARSGDIYKKQYEGLYCVGCEAFYARDELNENGECVEHPGRKLEEVKEENYFFRLSRYQQQLEGLVTGGEYRIIPESRKNEAMQFIRRGLEDFSISRSRARSRGWGVPVPNDPDQTMYVWFDALNVYRSAAPDRWPADLHIIGKGILRFHAVYWPAMLLSAKLPIPRQLFVHGYITVNGQKMSKTTGNIIDPMSLAKRYGADALRYYLLRDISPFDDADFTEQKFKESYNAGLANGLGNVVARVMTLAEANLNDPISRPEPQWFPSEYTSAIEAYEFNRALDFVWGRIQKLDHKIDDTKPFKIVKSDIAKGRALIQELAAELYGIGRLLNPFMPETNVAIKETILANKKPPTLFPRKE